MTNSQECLPSYRKAPMVLTGPCGFHWYRSAPVTMRNSFLPRDAVF